MTLATPLKFWLPLNFPVPPQPVHSLLSCFKQLPTCAAPPLLPPLQLAEPPASEQLHGKQHAQHAQHAMLADLPQPTLVQLLGSLAPRDLALASCTCRQLRVLCADVVPGMKLTLFPHQVNWGHKSLHMSVSLCVWGPGCGGEGGGRVIDCMGGRRAATSADTFALQQGSPRCRHKRAHCSLTTA